MRNKAFSYLLVLMLAQVPQLAHGDRGQLFKAGKHGISSTYVNQIMQDSRGFIWIATRGGLDRLDGGRVMSWHRGELPSDNVTSLAEDTEGRVIVGTTYGAVAYDHKSGQFSHIYTGDGEDPFNVRVMSLLALPDGSVIITSSGYGIYRLGAGETVAQHTRIYFEGGDALVSSAYSAVDDQTWYGGGKGVYCINREGEVKTYLADEGTGLCNVLVTNTGQVFVGTTNRGLYVYDPLSDRFVPQPTGTTSGIISLCALNNDSVAVGTINTGIYVLRRGSTQLEPYGFIHPQVDFSRTNVICMMQDRDGALWMGLSQKGVFMKPMRKKEVFRTIDLGACVMSVAADGDGTLWVGTDGDGLYHIDGATGNVLRHFAAGENGMPATLMALETDETEKLWLGSWQQGGGWIDKKTGIFHSFPFAKRDGVENVMGLATDTQGYLWVATGGKGMYRYNIASGKDTHFAVEVGSTPTSNTLSNHWPSNLQLSADGRLMYICMSSGLACYDIQRQSFTSQFSSNYVLGSFLVNTVRIGSDNKLWAGTDNGLLCLSPNGKTLRQFTTADGLPHNNVASLQFDKAGQLWVGTMNGLARMNADSTFSVYVASDGLQEGEWNDRAACALGDFVVMGGMDGLSIIDPSAARALVASVPSIQLVDAVIDQQKATLGHEFTMNHDAGSLSLRFSAMIYDRPEVVSYLYSINGAEYTLLPSRDGVLTLSHLASGNYTIRVKAVVGGTESEPLELRLTVCPPFYASRLANFLYIIICVLAAWGIAIVRRNRSRQQQALQEYIQAEQLKEAKLQFFMSLNHEIRTPMTLIVAPLQRLIATDPDEPRQQLYGIMQGATQRILTIINQILDLRKIDRGLLQMRMRPTNIVQLTRDVCALFEAKAAEHRILLHVDDRTNGCEVWVDPDHFDKVIMNLLSNAFKFTPDGGNVGVVIECSDTECLINVWDDGQSIAPENLKRVFERFFQEDNTVNRATAGTGIGLNLARQLVQLHHGTIEAQAMPEGQTGCAFVITLPLGDAHLSESEKYVEEASDSAEESNASTSSAARREGKKLRNTSRKPTIIIAEDEEDIRNYLVGELEGTYNVVPCADGRQALSEALRQSPALVLSDVMMPQMDGYTLCARLKSNTATNFVPVVLLTAKTRESDKLEGLGQGADAYIEKPFNIEIVRHTIRNLIAAHDLLRNKLSGNEMPLDRLDEVRIATPDEQLIERVTRVVNAHIDDPHLSVEQIAQEVGISRAHLHRKMKELTNLGPRDWVRNLRLQRASQMFLQGHTSIAQVMYACGFDNQSSFATKFKTQFGLTPSEHIKEHAK